MPTTNELAATLRLVMNPVRLAIVARLAESDAGMTELLAVTGTVRQTVLNAVKLLKTARVIESRRQGRRRFYCLAPEGERLAGLVREVLEMAEPS